MHERKDLQGRERMVSSQVLSESQPPSVGSWLRAGKSSRVSHSKVKTGLSGEDTHSIDRVWAVSGGRSCRGEWGLSVFVGVGNFIG